MLLYSGSTRRWCYAIFKIFRFMEIVTSDKNYTILLSKPVVAEIARPSYADENTV